MAVAKNILISAQLYGTGGRETHLLKLCRALVSAGAQVTVAVRTAKPSTPLIREAASIPVRIVSTPFAANQRWIRLSTLWALLIWPFVLNRKNVEVLYSFDISRFTSFLMRFLAPHGKLVLNRAGDLIRKEERQAATVPAPHTIIVESELQAQAMREFGANDIPVFVIPHLGHYEFPRPRFREQRNGNLKVAFLGRYDQNKGAYRLLDLWSSLSDSNLQLVFYGHGNRVMIKTKIDQQGLGDRVFIQEGWKSSEELAGIFGDTDFVVLPSFTEGLPLVLLESMAHGVPFVATDVGAVRTLAEANPDVLVVANTDEALKLGIEQMAGAIRAGDIDGQRLQKFHETHYGYEKLAKQWVEALMRPDEFLENGKVAPKTNVMRKFLTP